MSWLPVSFVLHYPGVKNLKIENGTECGGLASIDPGEITG
jgi:hypothetical protein